MNLGGIVSLLKNVESVNGSLPDSNVEESLVSRALGCSNLFSQLVKRESVPPQSSADRLVVPLEQLGPVILGPPVSPVVRSIVPKLERKTCLN